MYKYIYMHMYIYIQELMPLFSQQLCSTPKYRTAGDGTTRPLDHPPDITVQMNSNLKVCLYL
jgi:hypothetical protein